MSPDATVPEPPDPSALDPLITVWTAGRPLVRCHPSSYGATEFNPRAGTPGRFRPVRRRSRAVGTLYGADGAEGAVSETVFHDVPVRDEAKQVRLSRFNVYLRSTIAAGRGLRLVKLHGNGLRRVGATRAELIDSEADQYSALAAWGQALHDCPAEPDGLVWRSRQYDDALSVVLYGDRVRRAELEVVEPPLPLAIGSGLELVQRLAEDAGITLIG